MSDWTIRGMFRASEVVRAYEATYHGEQLVAALALEEEHASRVAECATDESVRDEWNGRRSLYRAALRRLRSVYLAA